MAPSGGPPPSCSRPGIKFTSLNARGLATSEKRFRLLSDLKKSRTQVVLIQETHFKHQAIPRLCNRDFPNAYHAASPLSKSKGVSILIAKSIPWTLLEERADPQGRYLSEITQ